MLAIPSFPSNSKKCHVKYLTMITLPGSSKGLYYKIIICVKICNFIIIPKVICLHQRKIQLQRVQPIKGGQALQTIGKVCKVSYYVNHLLYSLHLLLNNPFKI